MRRQIFAAASVAILLVVGQANAAPVISTVSGWNGTDAIGAFGETNSATYGQSFTVTGTETILNSFTLYLDDILNVNNPDAVDFKFYVADWDNVNKVTTGGVLYSSAAVSTTNNGGSGGMEAFTFSLLGGLQLVSGNDYIAYVSASGLFDGIGGIANAGSRLNSNAYSGGEFYWQNNGNSTSTWGTNTWETFVNFGDLAFTANFSAPVVSDVPVPASLVLWGLGSGMAVVGRKLRRRQAA